METSLSAVTHCSLPAHCYQLHSLQRAMGLQFRQMVLIIGGTQQWGNGNGECMHAHPHTCTCTQTHTPGNIWFNGEISKHSYHKSCTLSCVMYHIPACGLCCRYLNFWLGLTLPQLFTTRVLWGNTPTCLPPSVDS